MPNTSISSYIFNHKIFKRSKTVDKAAIKPVAVDKLYHPNQKSLSAILWADTLSEADEEELSLLLKKSLKTTKAKVNSSHLLQAVPELIDPKLLANKSTLFLSLPLANSSFLEKGNITALEDLNQSPLKKERIKLESDSNLEQEVFQAANNLKTSNYEKANLTFEDLKQQQKYRKILHEKLDNFHQELAKRAETSEHLKWVQMGSSISLSVLSVGMLIAGFFTGGLSTILGVLSTVASTVQAGTSITGSVLRLESQKTEGLVQETKEMRHLADEKIKAFLKDNNLTMQKIIEIWTILRTIVDNRAKTKIFS